MLCLCLEGEEHVNGEVQLMRLAPERASVGLLWPRRELWKVSSIFYGRRLGLEIILGNPVWYRGTHDNTGFLLHLISRTSVSNCQRSSVQALCLEMQRHILGRRCLEQPASVDDPKPHHPIFSRYFLDKRFAYHFLYEFPVCPDDGEAKLGEIQTHKKRDVSIEPRPKVFYKDIST